VPPRKERKSPKARKPNPGGFGQRLKELRAERDLTLRGLSERSGLSVTYLSDLERGVLANPTLSALSSIATALDVTSNFLVEAESEPTQAAPPSPPPALEQLRGWPQFTEAVADEARRRRIPVERLERQWIEALARIEVGGRRPQDPMDYMFVFEAMRRAIERT
jgi:transcriptional regulator with XRE-family HTH domain